jgi:hypothetical protein
MANEDFHHHEQYFFHSGQQLSFLRGASATKQSQEIAAALRASPCRKKSIPQ